MFKNLILITKDTIVKENDIVIELDGNRYIVPDRLFNKLIGYICNR